MLAEGAPLVYDGGRPALFVFGAIEAKGGKAVKLSVGRMYRHMGPAPVELLTVVDPYCFGDPRGGNEKAGLVGLVVVARGREFSLDHRPVGV